MPTNAIFGFASMLVKILTEYGPKATLVAWDAGMSGRGDISEDYKAQRRARPDLLQEQWPHLQPLVEAFGYKNIKVPGYEADDVIATLATRARDEGIDVMVVTGDRDMFQLIEPGIRVMATSRGITDTKIYDREAVVDRYGIPPELIPDFYGLKGDTSDNIPGVPGIGDKTASELLQRFGSLENVLDSIDDISGAKRKENLTAHAEAARISKILATAKIDVPVELDIAAEAGRAPDRGRLREVFREFELRDPLRRLEEAFGEDEAAPAPPAEQTVSARLRQASLAEVAALDGELAVAVREQSPPEDQLFAESELRFGVAANGEVLVGATVAPEDVVAACGGQPVVAHDAKALRDVPVNLVHDTLLAAYLLEPARRGYPFRELVEERGLAADVEDAAGADALLTRALAEWQREQLDQRGLTAVMRDIELPLVPVLRQMEVIGIRLNVPRLREITARVHGEIRDL